MKKNSPVSDYDSLVRLRKKLKKHVSKQEKEIAHSFGFIDKFAGSLGFGSYGNDSNSPIPVTEFVFPYINKFFSGIALKFAKSERSRNLITGGVFISSLALSVFINRKINRFFDKMIKNSK